MPVSRRSLVIGLPLAIGGLAAAPGWATQAERDEIDALASAALDRLYAEDPAARELAAKAKGILIFPRITKAGFVVGGQAGKGALRVGGASVAYYRTVSASLGFQIGAQTYSQVLMFMTDAALETFRTSDGWEAGVDGSVALIEQGASAGVDTTAAQAPIVGFVFGEEGLMAAANIEGSKYTKLDI